ncbi:MAG: hypothetical protein AAF600_06710 [Bacteroidota bacterium]
MNEEDLDKFQNWLRTCPVPCKKCGDIHQLPESLINAFVLSTDERVELTGLAFHLTKHEIMACANPSCDAFFSYPESAYVNAYFESQ